MQPAQIDFPHALCFPTLERSGNFFKTPYYRSGCSLQHLYYHYNPQGLYSTISPLGPLSYRKPYLRLPICLF